MQQIISNLNLKEKYFDHPSQIHGINHTYRVMVHAYILGSQILDEAGQKSALAAAFIHDMARKHDGYCTEHGGWAAENKLPVFKEMFEKLGINQWNIISDAVTNHSLYEEFPEDHPSWQITSILKDADALDRFRIGEKNLNVSFLRHPFTHEMIGFARELWSSTVNLNFRNFTDVLQHAKNISQQNKQPWSNIL
ncbi:MAG: HD domain-containing protein [Bacteroidetes bacterium]|nr:HD domain-containing protein [Bacteroidota bacterium]